LYLRFGCGVGDGGSSDAKEKGFGRLEFVEGGVGIVVALEAGLDVDLDIGVASDGI
jgi:hypothetical protein